MEAESRQGLQVIENKAYLRQIVWNALSSGEDWLLQGWAVLLPIAKGWIPNNIGRYTVNDFQNIKKWPPDGMLRTSYRVPLLLISYYDDVIQSG